MGQILKNGPTIEFYDMFGGNGGFIPDFLPRFSTAGPRFSMATEENLHTVEKHGLNFFDGIAILGGDLGR